MVDIFWQSMFMSGRQVGLKKLKKTRGIKRNECNQANLKTIVRARLFT